MRRSVRPRSGFGCVGRVSRGARRSLGWVPFKAASLKRKGRALRFCGKTFRIFEAERLNDKKWGCFAQDAVGDWWLYLSVEQPVEQRPALEESVGVDMVPVEPDLPVRVRYGWGACHATA